MKILVDADACPTKKEIISVARRHNIEVSFFVDINHRIESDYGTVITVDQGADSVDLKLINSMEAGDIIVSQDYGVASLALGKGGYVLHPNGYEIDNSNIDRLMFERHMSRKARKQRQRGPAIKKRTLLDDQRFEDSLNSMVLLKKEI